MRYTIAKNQEGTALFTALMILTLTTGLGMMAFRVSTTELQISTYSGEEAAALSLAESGIEKLFSWTTEPAGSPNPSFFNALSKKPCSGERVLPDFKASPLFLEEAEQGPFSELKEIGTLTDLRLYQSSRDGSGVCVAESNGTTRKGATKTVRVEIAKHPLPALTAGIMGAGAAVKGAAETGAIGEGGAGTEEGTIDSRRWNDVKAFIQKRGGYYVISPSGFLSQNGVEIGSFDKIFKEPNHKHFLAWIDVIPGYSRPGPIEIDGGGYRGYFYFAGDVQIRENSLRNTIDVRALNLSATDSEGESLSVDSVHLDGFFYTLGQVDLQGPFRVHGAVFAGAGLTGPYADQLQVWYNRDFGSADYPDVPPFVRLKGSWRSHPS